VEDWKLEPARDLGLPLREALQSHRRESGLLTTAGHHLWWGLVRGYLRLYHRLAVEGRENLPAEPPFVLVANHVSHLDALVLGAPLPARLRDRVFPVAAGDTFFEKPSQAFFAASFLNALPIWRRKCGAHALQQLRERLLREPCAYLLFPEGTRSRDGRLGRFKPGLGMLVAGTPVPVVPCHLDGTFRALPPHARLPRPCQIVVRVGEPLIFAGLPDERAGWAEVARTTAEAVRRLAGGAVEGSADA
jgi:1-acyl-sn-glycerol-3-phosphate acyltransferase